MKLVLLVAGLLLSSSALAVQSPSFEDFLVAEKFEGRPVPPSMSSHQARMFRTVLRQEASSGPNFAGHFTLARWGCGAGCISWAIIDARSGAVWFAPFEVWDAGGLPDSSLGQHSIEFNISSELIIANGALNGKGAGTYYYRWHGGKLSHIHSIEHKQ